MLSTDINHTLGNCCTVINFDNDQAWPSIQHQHLGAAVTNCSLLSGKVTLTYNYYIFVSLSLFKPVSLWTAAKQAKTEGAQLSQKSAKHKEAPPHIQCAQPLSRVQLFAAAYQVPLSMKFSRQEHWSGFLFPPPGDLSDPGIEPDLLCLLHCSWILYQLSH